MDNESLFTFAARIGANLGSLYRNNRSDRANLLEYMDSNDWFGMEYTMQDEAPFLSAVSLTCIKKSISLWLLAYKKPGREKLKLLLEHFQDQYPETCRLYGKYVSDRQMTDDPSAWKLLDFMLSEIDREITEYSDEDIERIIGILESGATRTAAKIFADFVSMAKQNGEALSRWKYSFNARDSPDLINTAYPLADFATMAYCVFNEEIWEQQDMINKAMQNKAYADLWLYAALHFICALRSGDISRIPAPALTHTSKAVMESLASGTFSKQEAAAIADELVIRLKLKPMMPSKTCAHENTPDLKLFVPQSLRAPLGLIIAIVLVQRPEIRAGDGFVKPNTNLANIRGFFGEHFAKALGNRRFSSRRCNKSYLQGIAAIADDAPGNPKGYMIAALARSHKSGVGTIANMTDVYLKDAQFTGYTPDFIIQQMFERGVFSFIPAVLLEMYSGKKYTQLAIADQTNLIGELGMVATQVERLCGMIDQAVIKSRSAVRDALSNPCDVKQNIISLLQNIASGNAPGRQEGCLCLLSAASRPCLYAVRDSCIGCGYEILTKTLMHYDKQVFM